MSRRRTAAAWALLAAAVAFFLVAPLLFRPYGIFLLSTWAVMTIAAIGLNLTLGYAGQISLAQAAFVGIGAYVTAYMTTRGWSFGNAYLLAGVACFIVGWLLGYPALRVQHHYLAFVTLAFNTLIYLIFRNEEWLTNGIYGITNIPRPDVLGWSTARPVPFYYFLLAHLAAISLATWGLIKSPWGRAFVAVRENPVRALSLGVDTRRYTLMAFALGAGLGGLSGALYAPLVQFIDPSPFALGLSLNLLLMVVVGGSGYFFGPFLGAVVAVLLPEWTRFAQGYYLMAYAILVMVLMIFSPTGLLGLFDRFLAARARAPASIEAGLESAR
jgi:branched-chain amino acid transport system permease protein